MPSDHPRLSILSVSLILILGRRMRSFAMLLLMPSEAVGWRHACQSGTWGLNILVKTKERMYMHMSYIYIYIEKERLENNMFNSQFFLF